MYNSYYDNNRPTLLYCYGYTETFQSLSVQTVLESYIERGDHNILVIEYSNYNDGNYFLQAVPNSYRIGEIFGKTLLDMRSLGFNVDKFHLVGHSLGGQLLGFVGRSYYNNSDRTLKLTRITGLDPAGPFFYGGGLLINQHINKDDGKDKFSLDKLSIKSNFAALFVDIIHTDYNRFGAPVETGTADFWPNGGRDQPGCNPGAYNYRNVESMMMFIER